MTRTLHLLLQLLFLQSLLTLAVKEGRRRNNPRRLKKSELKMVKMVKHAKKSKKPKHKHKHDDDNSNDFEVEIVDFDAALEDPVTDNSPIITADGNETILGSDNNTMTTDGNETSLDSNNTVSPILTNDGNETSLASNITLSPIFTPDGNETTLDSNSTMPPIMPVDGNETTLDTNSTMSPIFTIDRNETMLDSDSTNGTISLDNETAIEFDDNDEPVDLDDSNDTNETVSFDNETMSSGNETDQPIDTDGSEEPIDPDEDLSPDSALVNATNSSRPDDDGPDKKPPLEEPDIDRTDQIAVELPAFQMLYSMPLSDEEQEMDLLRATKLHLEAQLKDTEVAFSGLEMFQLLRQGTSQVLVRSMTMVAFGGSAYFDMMVPKDRLAEETMLAFLGLNLTRYQVSLREANLQVEHAQLYTIEGDMIAYSDGAMQVLGDWPQEEDVNSMTSIWLYIVSIGVPMLLCILICLGYCTLKVKGIGYFEPVDAPPEHETWHTIYHDDD